MRPRDDKPDCEWVAEPRFVSGTGMLARRVLGLYDLVCVGPESTELNEALGERETESLRRPGGCRE